MTPEMQQTNPNIATDMFSETQTASKRRHQYRKMCWVCGNLKLRRGNNYVQRERGNEEIFA